MRIVYGLPGKDVMRMDAIVIAASELPIGNGFVAFRGDDRKPSEIFAKGFDARDKNFALKGRHRVDDPRTWDDVFGGFASKHTDLMSMFGAPPITLQYSVGAQEIAFRPNHLDLHPPTCVSLSLDPHLTVGFPLNNTVGVTYLYAVHVRGRYLATHEVQRDGGNKTLAQSKEITCLDVPAADIIGAAAVRRTVTGQASLSTVTYELATWVDNPMHGNQKRYTFINETIKDRTGYDIAPMGTKQVAGGMKSSTNTASNPVLTKAIEALMRHTSIVPLTGTKPQHEKTKMSSNLNALLD